MMQKKYFPRFLQPIESNKEFKPLIGEPRSVYGFVIFQSQVVNANQRVVHLLLVCNEGTYDAHKSREISLVGQGNKRQLTFMVAYNAIGNVLLFQFFFKEKQNVVCLRADKLTTFKSTNDT